MDSTDRYRRYLKRRNFSPHTVKSYLNILAQFTAWLTVPLHETTRHEIDSYVDHLMGKRLIPEDHYLPPPDDPALLQLPHR